MSVYLKCDRCGAQEKTRAVMLFAGMAGPDISTARPELPDGWSRPTLPDPDGQAHQRELCPLCKSDLFRFMTGQPVIDAPLPVPAPQFCPDCDHLRHSVKCRDYVTEVGACGCPTLTTKEAMKELGIND